MFTRLAAKMSTLLTTTSQGFKSCIDLVSEQARAIPESEVSCLDARDARTTETNSDTAELVSKPDDANVVRQSSLSF